MSQTEKKFTQKSSQSDTDQNKFTHELSQTEFFFTKLFKKGKNVYIEQIKCKFTPKFTQSCLPMLCVMSQSVRSGEDVGIGSASGRSELARPGTLSRFVEEVQDRAIVLGLSWCLGLVF